MCAVLASRGFEGSDEELERSTAARWRWIRALHVVLAALGIGVALALTGLWEPRLYGAYELVRNGLAYLGLIGATAVALGARLAWVPALAYVAGADLAAPRPLIPGSAWWTWPMQPWSTPAAAWTAAALFAFGAALYAMFGARPNRINEAS
jgi:hypothetical protein